MIALTIIFVGFVGAMILAYGLQKNVSLENNTGELKTSYKRKSFPVLTVLGVWILLGTALVMFLIANDPSVSPFMETVNK
ncbi:hypothetical protein ACQWTT_001161 [Acinetobacter baumannii]